MKIHLRLLLIYSIIFTVNSQVQAFQFADATAPKPAQSGKFIFYWGQQQCDLTAEQQYGGHLRLTPTEFRQMLLSTPKLWNGAGLVPDFTFRLQDFPVRAKDYLGQIAALDQQFGRSAVAGQMLAISQLNLGNGDLAHIDVEFVAPEKDKRGIFGYQGYGPFLNNQLLETASWGLDEKFNINERDFFTVSEFWQIFGQEPYLEWRGWQEPSPVLAELQIIDAEEVTMSVRFELEQSPYSEFVKQAHIYQHLIKPGVRTTLLLQTGDQYERLFQKSLQLVADNDERLRLRRTRDFHTVQFRWGDWAENIEFLYLRKTADAEGKTTSVDEPIVRRSFITGNTDSIDAWAAITPTFLIDQDQINTASFTIHIGDNLEYRVQDGRFDAGDFRRTFSNDSLKKYGLRITDIELPGYDLPSIQLLTQGKLFNTRMSLFLANKFESLQQNVVTFPGYTLQSPVLEGQEWKFKAEIPSRGDLLFSVFNSEGSNIYLEDTTVKAGQNTFTVPAGTLPGKGKYHAFLNSIFGVVKVEFEVP